MNVKPLGSKVLVEQLIETERGGIAIPEEAQTRGLFGRVAALGTGKPNFKFTVKVGDKVVIPKLAGTYVLLERKWHLVFEEEDLLAIANSEKVS